jgi:hypothetical protein
MDWTALYSLKQRWKTSAAAMIRRAYDLRLINAVLYQRSYKYMAAQGWLKGEPDEFEHEETELVSLAMAELERTFGTSPRDVCDHLQWRERHFERITGIALPNPPVRPTHGGKVLQLSFLRDARNRSA